MGISAGESYCKECVALEELKIGDFATAEAYRAKERLFWVRKADTT